MKSILTTLFFLVFSLMNTQLKAEPWVDTSNIFLKANIQLLADNGHFSTPTTTYPLMWNDISKDMLNIDREQLNTNEKNAFDYIRYQLRLAKKAQTVFKLSTSTKGNPLTSFGDKNRYQHFVQIQSSYMTNSFAIKVAPGYAYSTDTYGEDDHEFINDGSYVAAVLGNWVVSYGRQDRWFGPAWDSNLAVNNNARPMQGFSLTRQSAIPFNIPFTEIAIPWTLTTYMTDMEKDRVVKAAKLWGFRFNFKPIHNLEIGITRLAQWAGHNQSKTLSSFADIVLGKKHCDSSPDRACNDNQQAGVDMRLSFNLLDTTLGLYGNYHLESKHNAAKQIGLDAQLNIINIPTTTFIEFSDSFTDCGKNNGIGDCYNEHNTYQTGMRYNGRAIGHLYDNDAKSVAVGMLNQLNYNITVTNKLRWLDLNYDNSDKAPENPIIGNPLANMAEKMMMYSINFEHSYKHWRYSLGGDFSHSNFTNTVEDDNEINLFLNIEYML